MSFVKKPIRELMTQTLARYHSRAPRYILQPEDNTLIRVAGPLQTPWEEATEIQDISLSGLAFTAPAELCPLVGEFIKVQFSLPQAAQMACYGLVTRLEKTSNSMMLVGIEFRKLELAHRIVLTQSLSRKMKEQITRQQRASIRPFWHTLALHWKKVILAIAALIAWGFLFYVFSDILLKT
jgi:hypothetical protein